MTNILSHFLVNCRPVHFSEACTKNLVSAADFESISAICRVPYERLGPNRGRIYQNTWVGLVTAHAWKQVLFFPDTERGLTRRQSAWHKLIPLQLKFAQGPFFFNIFYSGVKNFVFSIFKIKTWIFATLAGIFTTRIWTTPCRQRVFDFWFVLLPKA